MLNPKSIKYFKMAINSSNYKETPSDIACKCPICGDSKKKQNSKRLHLYTKDNVDTDFVSCFNAGCPCTNKNMYTFLRDFYPQLLPAYKKEMFNDKMNDLKQNVSLAELANTTNIKNITPKSEITPDLYKLDEYFEPLTEEYIEYLKSRDIKPNFNHEWFKAKKDIMIGSTLYGIKDYLVIPLVCNNLYYGFYSRSIHEKDFITFIGTTGFKVWNWFDIDKNNTTYIFEGIFDAISSGKKNIIANLGAKLPEERLKDLKKPVFCLDNDKTGKKTSIEYAEQGYDVFVMPSVFEEKDINELKINHPELDIPKMIDDNTFNGISAITRLKIKL